jgi:hypothetical protein
MLEKIEDVGIECSTKDRARGKRNVASRNLDDMKGDMMQFD